MPIEQVDIAAMQHKTPEYAAINPLQRMPALVLDDGTIITELIAICRYFEMTIRSRHCSALVRKTLQLSKCGTAGQRSIFSPTLRRFFVTRIRR